MKKLKMKPLLAAFAFALAFGLFGTPAAPGTSVVPTVGGVAAAYAPCSYEYMTMQVAWDYFMSDGGPVAYLRYLHAAWDSYSCMRG